MDRHAYKDDIAVTLDIYEVYTILNKHVLLWFIFKNGINITILSIRAKLWLLIYDDEYKITTLIIKTWTKSRTTTAMLNSRYKLTLIVWEIKSSGPVDYI